MTVVDLIAQIYDLSKLQTPAFFWYVCFATKEPRTKLLIVFTAEKIFDYVNGGNLRPSNPFPKLEMYNAKIGENLRKQIASENIARDKK